MSMLHNVTKFIKMIAHPDAIKEVVFDFYISHVKYVHIKLLIIFLFIYSALVQVELCLLKYAPDSQDEYVGKHMK